MTTQQKFAFSIQTKKGEILEITHSYKKALKVKKEIESNPELDSVNIVQIKR